MRETTETPMISAKAANMLYLEKERYRTIVTQLLGAYTRAFPNYAWDDSETAIDLMLAEITTLRWEKERYKAALDLMANGSYTNTWARQTARIALEGDKPL